MSSSTPSHPSPVPPADECDPQQLATFPSVVLLVDRVRAVDRTFAVTPADAVAVRDIVRALDGLPLALEIAAPWLVPLTPAGLLAELRHPLDMPGRRTDVEERHRSLRAMIAWSYDRLSTDEQRLLARLSVLRGGGDLDAVRAVGGADLGAPAVDVLMDLLDRHLVRPAEPVAGAPRFSLLETVREFAAERLAASGEQAATELRAAEWFARWAVGLAAHSEGPDADAWLSRTVAEAENLRAAMDVYERAGRTEEQLQLVVDAMALWFSVGYEARGRAAPRRGPRRGTAGRPRARGGPGLPLLVRRRARSRSREGSRRAGGHAGTGPGGRLRPGSRALHPRPKSAPDAAAMRRDSLQVAALAEGLRGTPVRYADAAPDALVTRGRGQHVGLRHVPGRAGSAPLGGARRGGRRAQRRSPAARPAPGRC